MELFNVWANFLYRQEIPKLKISIVSADQHTNTTQTKGTTF